MSATRRAWRQPASTRVFGGPTTMRPEISCNCWIEVYWKLYELNGHFYRGRPKDGSMRIADLPPFLSDLLMWHIRNGEGRHCTCRPRVDTKQQHVAWCEGDSYVFLGPRGGHFRRSNYSERVMRPAADGWHPGRKGSNPRPSMPVLVDLATGWPGRPLPPWPAAVPGQPYTEPSGRGRPRLGPETMIASWTPVLRGLTPHGLRHGHQTWMDEIGTSYVLQSDRMGHEVPGMRGVYSHVSPRMRQNLVAGLQQLWEESLADRTKLSPRSSVPLLDALLRAGTGRRAAL
jgi:hypothetical protein